jgi:glycosyltransferase involved in cell wall biosynthesis
LAGRTKSSLKRKIVISINSAWNIYNFRAGLIKALIKSGYEVLAVAPRDSYVEEITKMGVRFIPLEMDAKGINPFNEILLLIRYFLILAKEKPSVFLGFTIKPNIYGSLVARILGIKFINNVAGLGTLFSHRTVLCRLAELMYKIGLSGSAKIYFQNKDDQKHFERKNIISLQETELLPGSGVNLKHFSFSPLRHDEKSKRVRFILMARMLWEKGIAEFVEAAKLLKQKYPHSEYCLLGFLDVQNPTAISRKQMDQWVSEHSITYLGVSRDIRLHLKNADCVVLPSFYREGVPHSLLEGAAMGRPIVTSDSVGCREVVDKGENGYLCKPRNAFDLAEKMSLILEMSHQERSEMGVKSRLKMEKEFDEEIVISQYLKCISENTNSQHSTI